MVKAFLPVVLALMGCQAAEQQVLAHNDFSPLGTWSSRDGFSIKIDNDMTYRVCDGGECDSGSYVKESSGALIIKEFFFKKPAQRFIIASEAQRPCNGESLCADSSGNKIIHGNDLYFTDTVAPVDKPRKCGNVDCVIIGNVETAAGTLHKTQ